MKTGAKEDRWEKRESSENIRAKQERLSAAAEIRLSGRT